MSTFKKCKIIELLTEDEGIFYWKGKTKIIIRKHLYILSDEEIKEGDWYAYKTNFLNGTVKTKEQLDNAKWNIKKCESEEELAYIHRAQFGKNAKNGISGCKKIIATTYTSLTIGEENPWKNRKDILYPNKLPQPSQEFIEKYIKEYNKGNIITDVLVEYEIYRAYCKGCNQVGLRHCAHADTCGGPVNLIRPKISKDNTITIHSVKNSWNREEVEDMYSVVPFPEVQEYMEEDWFDEEAILDVNNTLGLGSSTYLIPNKYII